MRAALLALLLLASPAVFAGEADIIAVAAERHPGTEDMFDFRVTILSNDTGPDYHADALEISTPDGRLLARHELKQPSLNEQPFTTVLQDLKVPVGIERVTVRARHKPRGYDGQSVSIQLPR
jgi:hypothetical protein